jgi:hypothetical protein
MYSVEKLRLCLGCEMHPEDIGDVGKLAIMEESASFTRVVAAKYMYFRI